MPTIHLNEEALQILEKLRHPGQSFSGVVIEHLKEKVKEKRDDDGEVVHSNQIR